MVLLSEATRMRCSHAVQVRLPASPMPSGNSGRSLTQQLRRLVGTGELWSPEAVPGFNRHLPIIARGDNPVDLRHVDVPTERKGPYVRIGVPLLQ